MGIRKIHWPDYKWQAHPHLDPALHEVDFALYKWAVWMRLYAKARGLSIEQMFGMGMMSGTAATARWVPKQQQWVDLAIAALYRKHKDIAKLLYAHYIDGLNPNDGSDRLNISRQTFIFRLRCARYAIMGALTVMQSENLNDRASNIHRKKDKK